MLRTIKVCTINVNQHFDFVKQASIKFVGQFIICVCAKGFFFEKDKELALKYPFIYLGIKASKKFGNAVARNKFKRRIRALVRLNPDIYNGFTTQGLNFIIIARNFAKGCDFNSIALEYKKAWSFISKSI